MKATKFLVIVASCVALFAAVAWALRDYLIERISNPILDEYGIAVADVSLDALATDDASISYLELVHDKGTTVAIEDLTLPIGKSSGPRTYTAGKVSVITATRTEGALLELAALIGQFLSLPDTLDDSVLRIAEFKLSPYPTVHAVEWDISGREQRLSGVVESVPMSVLIKRKDAHNHDVVFAVTSESAPEQGRSVTGNLRQGTQSVSLVGASPIDLPRWVPLARLAGVIPPQVELASGTAKVTFNVDIPNDATQTPTVDADVVPTSSLQLSYSDQSDEKATFSVETAGNLSLEATFPEIDWSLRLEEAALTITWAGWPEFPLLLSEVSCRAGPICSMATRISIDEAELPVGRVTQLTLTSSENVSFLDAGLRVDVLPGATLGVMGFESAASQVGRLEVQLVSDATIDVAENGWQLATDSADAKIETMSLSDSVAVSLPLFLENIVASDRDQGPSMNAGVYAPSMQATVGEHKVALPGFKGETSLGQNELRVDLRTVGLQQDGTISVIHNLDTQTGLMNIGDAAVSFGATSLSSRISPWPTDADIVSGTTALVLSADWKREEPGFAVDAQAALVAAELAGYYGDTAFAGLSTQIETRYRSGPGFATEPSTLSIALVEIGLPVENLSAEYVLDLNELSVDVEDLRMTAVGGVIEADPFSFRTESPSNTLILRAESLDLRELLSLQEFEAIDVRGRIDATLPVTIDTGTVTIVDGALTGDPAGGVIRYTPDSTPDLSDASSIGFATRVLSNFEFETLTSDVNLTRDGDLNLKLQLKGRNPDLDEKRPVVLNLGVENNIPQMLRSLRAARAVEEVLEKRLGK